MTQVGSMTNSTTLQPIFRNEREEKKIKRFTIILLFFHYFIIELRFDLFVMFRKKKKRKKRNICKRIKRKDEDGTTRFIRTNFSQRDEQRSTNQRQLKTN